MSPPLTAILWLMGAIALCAQGEEEPGDQWTGMSATATGPDGKTLYLACDRSNEIAAVSSWKSGWFDAFRCRELPPDPLPWWIEFP